MDTETFAAQVIATGDAEADPEDGSSGRPLNIGFATRTWRSGLMVLGGGGALAVAWTNPDRGIEPRWYTWAVVATLLGVVSGSSFGSGVARRKEVNEIQRVPSWRVVPAVTFFVVVAAAAVPLSGVFVRNALTWRGAAFAAIGILAALPAGAALAAIRVLALRGLRGGAGRQLAGLLALRRMLTRLVTILGSLVVLVTLVNAAGYNWGSGQRIPVGAVVFTGASGALLVALVYIPTATLLRRRCAAYVDEHFALDNVGRAGLVAAAEERSKLEDLLGVNRSTLAELQAALFIISPLLASAGISLLPTL